MCINLSFLDRMFLFFNICQRSLAFSSGRMYPQSRISYTLLGTYDTYHTFVLWYLVRYLVLSVHVLLTAILVYRGMYIDLYEQLNNLK